MDCTAATVWCQAVRRSALTLAPSLSVLHSPCTPPRPVLQGLPPSRADVFKQTGTQHVLMRDVSSNARQRCRYTGDTLGNDAQYTQWVHTCRRQSLRHAHLAARHAFATAHCTLRFLECWLDAPRGSARGSRSGSHFCCLQLDGEPWLCLLASVAGPMQSSQSMPPVAVTSPSQTAQGSLPMVMSSSVSTVSAQCQHSVSTGVVTHGCHGGGFKCVSPAGSVQKKRFGS